MISQLEIEAKSEELGVHVANVQRDYVFGWLLAGMYNGGNGLRDKLILKGGNAFRKAFFPHARFSNDLDFSAQASVDPGDLRSGVIQACEFAAERSGIEFEVANTRVEQVGSVVSDASRLEVRVYFRSFYAEENIRIKVELDVTEFDRIILPIQDRRLVHGYSDDDICQATLRCHKVEELLAAKLKALLQRRHSPDLYDFVHAVFFQRSLDVSRREIITTFLKKTIYEPDPRMARGLLLDLPLEVIKGLWSEYLVCPRQSLIEFDQAWQWFRTGVEDLFALLAPPRPAAAFAGPAGAFAGPAVASYSAGPRNTILEAGRLKRLLRLTYDGVSRLVEPYSLVYKRRKDGVAREYFYVWDRTGGQSGPGVKSFWPEKVRSVQMTDTPFEPQYPIELTKGSGYFAQPFSSRPTSPRPRGAQSGTTATYTIQCPICDKKFRRSAMDTRLNEHKDRYGNKCFGRIGILTW